MTLHSSTPDSLASFFVAGGTIQRDAACYVTRKADTDLLNGLLAGQFCYVLTSRQMGKSSLMVRTAMRLREQGVRVAILDLTAIGQNLTPEKWYDGLLVRVGRQFDLEDELEDFWEHNARLGPLQWWMEALREVVLKHVAGRVVIFVDEIDTVRSLPFSTDEFFAAIRECYNRRTEDPEMARLSFCLLGVATPTDLIRDTRMTPFNIGKRIELTDFTPEEARPLAGGLNHGAHGGHGEKLLQRALYWTNGHPYLTQRLCQALVETQKQGVGSNPTPNTQHPTPADVDRHCEELFLSKRARERDDNLIFVRERLLQSGADLGGLLELYGKVRSGKRVAEDETNPLVSILRLSGITQFIGRYLQVRNRIYSRVFDHDWIIENTPGAELRRQRKAYRRGILRAGAVFIGIIIILLSGGVNDVSLIGGKYQYQLGDNYWIVKPTDKDTKESELEWSARAFCLYKVIGGPMATDTEDNKAASAALNQTVFGSGSLPIGGAVSPGRPEAVYNYRVSRWIGGAYKDIQVHYIYTRKGTPLQALDVSAKNPKNWQALDGAQIELNVPARGVAKLDLANLASENNDITWWMVKKPDEKSPFVFYYPKANGLLKPLGNAKLNRGTLAEHLKIKMRDSSSTEKAEDDIVLVTTDAIRPIIKIRLVYDPTLLFR